MKIKFQFFVGYFVAILIYAILALFSGLNTDSDNIIIGLIIIGTVTFFVSLFTGALE